MIIVVVHNNESGETQLMWEGGDPTRAKDVLATVVTQLAQQQAPPRLIVPDVQLPKDFKP